MPVNKSKKTRVTLSVPAITMKRIRLRLAKLGLSVNLSKICSEALRLEALRLKKLVIRKQKRGKR